MYISIKGTSIQPKILEISVGTSNGMYQFGLVWPEYSGTALKVVHFDLSGQFSDGGTEMSLFIWQSWCPPSTALLFPAHKNNNHTHVGLGRVCATGM